MSLCRRFVLFVVCLLALPVAANAQEGVSSGAATRTRYLSENGVFPTSREVAVEEFVNYYRHQIAFPTSNEAVAMDVRWGNDTASDGRGAVLQVGFSTAHEHDRSHLKPVNLSIVVDKSGSMADYNKLTRVKQALITLVSQLRSTDYLSIVIFDDQAEVLLPSTDLSDKEEVNHLIHGIQPGGSTNLNGGLMLGYKEAMKHFREGATNRVILLTDGIANRGVTDPAEIEASSHYYNDEGVDLSTIGVGMDLNKDLLRELAKSGRGLYHFVADDEDVNKVFVKELQSLVSPVAAEPNLTIEFAPGLHLDKVYGYDPHCGDHKVTIKLDNMNSGVTEVVLLRFRADDSGEDVSRLPVKVRLSYHDLDRGKDVVKSQETYLKIGEGSRDMLDDEEVAKNYTVAVLAQSIRDMAAACEERDFRKAEHLLDASISRARDRYPDLDDVDIKRTLSIAENYRQMLRRRDGDDGRDDGGSG